ncbi:MAG: hypothetical protein ACQESC_03595 [Nanobdellota archaeon]
MSQESMKPEKTDPRLRFNLFKKAENELKFKLREHEKEIKRLLAELETIRNLIEEAGDDIEQKQQEQLENERENIEKQRVALEEFIRKSEESRNENEDETITELPDNYTPITAQRLTTATSYSTRQELYLLQKKEEWTPDDAYKFFEISDAIRTTQTYDFSTPIQENISQTYSLLQDVISKREEEIESKYDSTLASKVDTYNTTTPLQNNKETTLENKMMSDSYNNIKPAELKTKQKQSDTFKPQQELQNDKYTIKK